MIAHIMKYWHPARPLSSLVANGEGRRFIELRRL